MVVSSSEWVWKASPVSVRLNCIARVGFDYKLNIFIRIFNVRFFIVVLLVVRFHLTLEHFTVLRFKLVYGCYHLGFVIHTNDVIDQNQLESSTRARNVSGFDKMLSFSITNVCVQFVMRPSHTLTTICGFVGFATLRLRCTNAPF